MFVASERPTERPKTERNGSVFRPGLKTESFGNGTKIKNAKIQTFQFHTLTVLNEFRANFYINLYLISQCQDSLPRVHAEPDVPDLAILELELFQDAHLWTRKLINTVERQNPNVRISDILESVPFPNSSAFERCSITELQSTSEIRTKTCSN